MNINAEKMHFKTLNEAIKSCPERDIIIENCMGQRYIASGLSQKNITIYGTPGNALGAYLSGADITVKGNAQDATGDTMDQGSITIYGNSGDATGYAMRGGRIMVQGDAGYRAGIHMKAYEKKVPCLVVGGRVGSFLGEYQAGGSIIVLGLGYEGQQITGPFCGTGMHGGKIYLRCDALPPHLPKQVVGREAGPEDMQAIMGDLEDFCSCFGESLAKILERKFYLLLPDTRNPYHQLYTYN